MPDKRPHADVAVGWLILFGMAFFSAVFVFKLSYKLILTVTDPGLADNNELLGKAVDAASLEPTGVAATWMLQACMVIPLILYASNYPSQGWKETLVLRSVAVKTVFFWVSVSAVVGIVRLAGLFLFDTSELPSYASSFIGSESIALVIAMSFIAPVIEELIFRGYLFNAWRYSRLGLYGTVVLTSVLFALIHGFQYSAFNVFTVFFASLLLGLAREKTGSLLVPFAMHSFNNFVAMVFVVYVTPGLT